MTLVQNPHLAEIYSRVSDLRAATQKEFVERELVVKESTPYQNLQVLIDDLAARLQDLKSQQDAMLSQVPDSRGALMEAEGELSEIMKATGQDRVGDYRLKYSYSNKVDPLDVYHFLDGDTEKFLKFVTVTKKSVEDYSKENEDKRILKCIKTTATPSGIEYKPSNA